MPAPFMYASPEQVMKDKADYARKGIARGKAIVALEYDNGILFVAENPSSTLHKVSEIYDRLAFAGVGKYNEYENLRIAGIRQADLKGYAYSRDDVTARSLANMYSQTLGQIFTEAPKPFEVEILLAQVGQGDSPNELYHVMYDGTMADEHVYIALGGQSEDLNAHLSANYAEGAGVEASIRLAVAALTNSGERELPAEQVEVAVLDRTVGRRKFVRFSDEQVASALTP